jgi:hypothetical protein
VGVFRLGNAQAVTTADWLPLWTLDAASCNASSLAHAHDYYYPSSSSHHHASNTLEHCLKLV